MQTERNTSQVSVAEPRTVCVLAGPGRAEEGGGPQGSRRDPTVQVAERRVEVGTEIRRPDRPVGRGAQVLMTSIAPETGRSAAFLNPCRPRANATSF